MTRGTQTELVEVNAFPGHRDLDHAMESRVNVAGTQMRPTLYRSSFSRRPGVATRSRSGSCRLMNTTWTVALVALLIFAGGTDSVLADLCPAPLLDGALTIPGKATLHLKASMQDGGVTLTSPREAISGRVSVTCETGEFRAIFYGMSDGSLYRCLGTIDGQKFAGRCVIGGVTGEISGQFLARP